MLNSAGTTFKKLSDRDKEGLSEAKAIKLMLAQPSMIKRPVLELPRGKLLVGFKPEEYERALGRDLSRSSPRRRGPGAGVPIGKVQDSAYAGMSGVRTGPTP